MLQTDTFFAVASHLVFNACEIIREAVQHTDLHITMKSENNPVTITDIKIQTIILSCLRAVWPNIHTVGEEAIDYQGELTHSTANLLESLEMAKCFTNSSSELELNKVCVWVDPLDGTNGFCSGNLDEITVLIGLSYEGKARLGIIGVPYYRDEHHNLVYCPKIIYGDAEQHCVYELAQNGNISQLPQPSTTKEIRLIGSKHRSQKLDETLAQISPCVVSIGGCGAKFIRLLGSEFNSIVNLSNKSSRWDTCAGHAVILALGGVVCTLQGTEISYEESSCPTNEQGFVCLMNRELLPQVLAVTCNFEIEG